MLTYCLSTFTMYTTNVFHCVCLYLTMVFNVVLCSVALCPPLPWIEHGNWTEGADGRTVRFYCDEGFSLYGSPVLYCENYGQWNGSVPICQRKCVPGHAEVGQALRTYMYNVTDRER